MGHQQCLSQWLSIRRCVYVSTWRLHSSYQAKSYLQIEKSFIWFEIVPKGLVWWTKRCIIHWGFQDSKSNVTLFLYKSKGVVLMLLVYMDDILIIRNNSIVISELVNDLNKSFFSKGSWFVVFLPKNWNI